MYKMYNIIEELCRGKNIKVGKRIFLTAARVCGIIAKNKKSEIAIKNRTLQLQIADEIADENPPPFLRAGSFYFLTVAARLVASSCRVTKSRGLSMVPPTSVISPASMAWAM